MKTLSASLVAATLAAPAAEAEERAAGRVAPPDVYVVAPGLGEYTDSLLFGDIWLRKELAPRDRSIATVSALIASGRIAQVGGHVGRALDNGVTPGEIGGIITHLAFYSGWPNAISAVQATKELFDRRGIGAVGADGAAPPDLDAAAEADRAASPDVKRLSTAPAFAEYTKQVLFGDLWRRPDLSMRDRSLVTIAALVATGATAELPMHVRQGMNNGLTRTELAEVPLHLAFYAGWPKAMAIMPVLQAALEEQAAEAAGGSSSAPVRVRKFDHAKSTTGSLDHFTGAVKVESAFKADEPARVSGGTVHFAAGARTAWHTHPLGQTLIVTAGTGHVQHWGGPVETIRPGDVVWVSPGVKHWHGATSATGMSHVAVAEVRDGRVVEWLEQVSDEQYPD
jgi:4-carboxymuconolactone decarboxylase